MHKSLVFLPILGLGCASTTSYVHSDGTTLGRVVVYRNGVAYFERTARVDKDVLALSVPADKIDDFLKSLTVTDAHTGEPTPVDFPSGTGAPTSGFTEMKIHLSGKQPHDLKLTYVTETPAWKSSYRVVLDKDGKVGLQGWAIVDNTSGEDWTNVKLGVGSSSALSFRFDLRSVRFVKRETLQSNDLFAQAPPTGGATYGQTQQPQNRIIGDISDQVMAVAEAPPPAPMAEQSLTLAGKGPSAKPSRKSGAAAPEMARAAPPSAVAPPAPAKPTVDVAGIAGAVRAANRPIVVEGYADPSDTDKYGASLLRANRMRDQLIQHGVSPNLVVAKGQGEQTGRAGGVRIVEAPTPPGGSTDKSADNQSPESLEPIGTSHFESKSAMTVARGTSAMVSILDRKTDGEVVYYYDDESPRGNKGFPFKAVRLKNPTESVLESGPVTVFGEGRFIGEGLSEPIPSRATAFIPFALDRQIVMEKKDRDQDAISRIISVQRGVFSTEVQHTRRFTYTMHNRLTEPTTVYVRHTVGAGYKLAKLEKEKVERMGGADIFRVDVPAGASKELVIEESTPVYKTIDLRAPTDMDQVRVYLSAEGTDGPLKRSIEELIKMQQELGNIEQRMLTTRDQMQAYRTRMEELHAQVVSLRLVKSGGALMKNLEKKLGDVSEKLSQATVDLAALEEKAMLVRVHFQDGIAELSLETASK